MSVVRVNDSSRLLKLLGSCSKIADAGVEVTLEEVGRRDRRRATTAGLGSAVTEILIGTAVGMVLITIDELWLEPLIRRRRIERALRALMLLSRCAAGRPRIPGGTECFAAVSVSTESTRQDRS